MAEQSYILLCRYWICRRNANVFIMTESQIKANEQFFTNMLNSLHEYGIWCWKDKNLIYKKIGDKLAANADDLVFIKEIVSEEYFNNHFVTTN